MTDETTPAALLQKLRSGRALSLTANEQKIIIGALARSLGEKIAGDDVPGGAGQPNSPVRLPPKASLFKPLESTRANTQGTAIAEAADTDEGRATREEFDALAQEIITAMDDPERCPRGVPPDIRRKVAQLLDDLRLQAGHVDADAVAFGMDTALRLGLDVDEHWAASFGRQDPSRDARRGAEAPAAIAGMFQSHRHV